jgi:hypothetical protein
MTELSNAVTVLIARMESHPEDFEMYGAQKAKFGDTAEALYELAGVIDGKGKASAYWFLSDADKEALIEAWKKFHCVRMEKRVMEAIFDDGAEEREREMERLKMRQQMYQAQQAAMAQDSLIHPMQNSYPYTVNAQQGLLGSGGNAAQQGMMVHSNGAVEMTNTLSLGGETIDSSILKKLKDLVK